MMYNHNNEKLISLENLQEVCYSVFDEECIIYFYYFNKERIMISIASEQKAKIVLGVIHKMIVERGTK